VKWRNGTAPDWQWEENGYGMGSDNERWTRRLRHERWRTTNRGARRPRYFLYLFFFCSTNWLFTIMLRVTATDSRSTFDVPPQPLWALSLANSRWGRFLVIFFLCPALMPRRSHNLRTTTPSQAKVRGGPYTQHHCLPFETFRRGIYFIIFIYII
jgi:hypothetical protein